MKLPFDKMKLPQRKEIIARQLSPMKADDPGLMEDLKGFLEKKLEERERKPGLEKIGNHTAWKLEITYNILIGLQEKEFREYRQRPKRKWVTPEEMAGQQHGPSAHDQENYSGKFRFEK